MKQEIIELNKEIRQASWKQGQLLEQEKTGELPEIERPNKSEGGKKLNIIPMATQIDAGMRKEGPYLNGKGFDRPCGAVIHFTAGHHGTRQDAINIMNYGGRSGLEYMNIAETGELFQDNPLDEKGDHAGVSKHEIIHPTRGKITVTSLSNYLCGFEMDNPGGLTDKGSHYESWFGKKYDKNDPRINVVTKQNGNIQPGIYLKYTPEQIETLIRVLCWMKWNDPQGFFFENVLGHDEIAPTRKNDPGGALGVTMADFRETLRIKYERNYEQVQG